jgi:hypothetical protein
MNIDIHQTVFHFRVAQLKYHVFSWNTDFQHTGGSLSGMLEVSIITAHKMSDSILKNEWGYKDRLTVYLINT